MISASALNSELINKIAQDFAYATGLAVVVVNIHGDEISELFNFTPFCQLMRQHLQHSTRCRMSDRWQADPELLNEFRNVPEMDYSRVIASADLLKLIVENCLKKQLNFVVIKDNPQQSEANKTTRGPTPHDSKMKKALRYIDAHLSDDLRLEDVASHVYLSPYYFSKLFKKYQGIGFNAWVNRQRMVSARELLCHSDWSIASIARNLGFSQTSYFCKVFRQTYQVTPQAYRQQINENSHPPSL
ncbi:AraC family transcriptional regulator [Salmonella enterica]|nr:AraC family transcriptional regulator [Salmonella enterica]